MPAPTSQHENHLENYLQNLTNIKNDKHELSKVIDQIYKSQDTSPVEHSLEGLEIEENASIDPGHDNKKVLGICDPALNVEHLFSGSTISQMEPASLFKGYDHAKWYVSNAKQTASYFMTSFGFEWIAYKGLETGSKLISSYVVKNNNVTFEFISPLHGTALDPRDAEYLDSIHEFLRLHGDGVKDVAFEVEDVELVYKNAMNHGAKSVMRPRTETDEFGSVVIATIEVCENVHHTIVSRDRYTGVFLPGFDKVEGNPDYELVDASCIHNLPPIRINKIDHCVQNENWNEMNAACEMYKKILGFHTFWSVDEKDVSTKYSALRSIVMSSENEEIKMPINEPAEGVCKSQIEEFLDFYSGPGIQHIAILTDDIVTTVRNMKLRGAQFIKIPPLYYEKLLPKILETGIKIEESLSDLKELGILIDFDRGGYLLQLFTKPLSDRPTFFLEIIQRHNHQGFGRGNFKALFESIESEQRRRGTLDK